MSLPPVESLEWTDDQWTAWWRRDYEGFARHNLRIAPKEDVPTGVVPFLLNAAQLKLHEAAQDQLRRIGKVRLVIPKARQLGISSGIAGEFFTDALLRPGTRVSVIAHKKDATSNLAEMTRRFYRHLPPDLRVDLTKDNQTELHFAHESSYTLATAGMGGESGGVGRSRTASHLHCSEFAFWHAGDAHLAGLGQALADVPGSKGYIESTTQGQANSFYALYQRAVAGVTDWEALFLEWYLDPSYSRPVPPGWSPSGEVPEEGYPSEVEYMDKHGLSMEQAYWRHVKFHEIGLDRWCREYPGDAEEAFRTSGATAYLNAVHVAEARKRSIAERYAEMSSMALGIDCASSHGPDNTVFARRRRYKGYPLEVYPAMTGDEILARAWTIWREEQPVLIAVDRAGIGDHVYTGLLQRGAPIVGVHFGGKPDDPSRYADRRAELYSRLIPWLPEGDLPDDQELVRDLLSMRQVSKEQPKIRLMSKPDLKALGFPSSDRGDAFALTFMYVDREADGRDAGFTAPGPFDAAGEPPHTPFTPRPGPDYGGVTAPMEGW